MSFFTMGDNSAMSNNVYDTDVDRIYGYVFSYDLRQFVATFLDFDFNKSVLAEKQRQKNKIENFIYALKLETNRKVQEMKNHILYQKWESQNQQIQKMETFELFKLVQTSLKKEQKIRLSKQCKVETNQLPDLPPVVPGPSTGTTHSASSIANGPSAQIEQEQTMKVFKIERTFKEIQKQHDFIPDRIQQLHGQFATIENGVGIQIWDFGVSLAQHVVSLNKVLDDVLNELKAFNEDQRTIDIGRNRNKNLDNIENWLNRILNFCQQLEDNCLRQYETMCQNTQWLVPKPFYPVSDAKSEIAAMREKIKANSFIFAQQPQQIMRTLTKGDGGIVRLLSSLWTEIPKEYILIEIFLANRTAAHNISNGPVGYNILHEDVILIHSGNLQDSNAVTQDNTKPTKDIYKLDVDIPTIARDVKWGTQTTEPFWLCVRVTIGQDTFTALSLPIWIVSNPSQKSKPWSHLLWHQCFPLQPGMDYKLDVPNKIHWRVLVDGVSFQCGSLNEEQKMHLRNLMFRNKVPEDGLITLKQFCKDQFSFRNKDGELPQNVTSKSANIQKKAFGEWLHYCVDLINKKNIRGYWDAGYIVGFMDEKKYIRLLKTLRPQSFVIRFPAAWADCVGLYSYDGKKKAPVKQIFTSVKHLRPLQFQLRPHIVASKDIKWLYKPQEIHDLVDKDVAFKEVLGMASAAVSFGGNGYFLLKTPLYWPDDDMDYSEENFPSVHDSDSEPEEPDIHLPDPEETETEEVFPVVEHFHVPGPSESFLNSFNIPYTSVYSQAPQDTEMLTDDEEL